MIILASMHFSQIWVILAKVCASKYCKRFFFFYKLYTKI